MTSVATFFFAKLKIESMSDDRKKITLEWKGNFRFEAKNPNGLTVNFDAPKKYGETEQRLHLWKLF